jgi:hypothetical protein
MSDHVGFVVDKMELGLVFPGYFCFGSTFIYHPKLHHLDADSVVKQSTINISCDVMQYSPV